MNFVLETECSQKINNTLKPKPSASFRFHLQVDALALANGWKRQSHITDYQHPGVCRTEHL